MTQVQLKDKLEKIARLAVAGATAGERSSALDKLHKLCKKHSVKLTDYVGGLSEAYASIDYTAKAQNSASDAAKSASKKKASRRSLIIKYVQQNTFTTAGLAKFLKTFDYNDVKANKKAVAGTLYDMQKNKNWQVIRHANGIIEIKK